MMAEFSTTFSDFAAVLDKVVRRVDLSRSIALQADRVIKNRYPEAEVSVSSIDRSSAEATIVLPETGVVAR